MHVSFLGWNDHDISLHLGNKALRCENIGNACGSEQSASNIVLFELFETLGK